MTSYPELAKMRAQREALHTEAIGDFLEWLKGHNVQLTRWEDFDGTPCPYKDRLKLEVPVDEHTRRFCAGCGARIPIRGPIEHAWLEEPRHRYIPIHASTEALLAEYAGIDLKRVEVERREMLAALADTGPIPISTSTSTEGTDP